MINYRAVTGLLLRISLASIFLYFGIQAVIDPVTAISYIPAYAEAVFANQTFITGWGVAQILVGISLFIGFYTRITAFIAAAMLIPIMIALGVNEVMYRDVIIFFAALHLAFEPAYLWAVKQ